MKTNSLLLLHLFACFSCQFADPPVKRQRVDIVGQAKEAIQRLEVDTFAALIKQHGYELQSPGRKAPLGELIRALAQKESDLEHFWGSDYSDQLSEAFKQLKNIREIRALLSSLYFLDLPFPTTFFTNPHMHPSSSTTVLDILKALVVQEKKEICICMFHFTYFPLARLLVEQHKMFGIPITVITDRNTKGLNTEALNYLAQNGIPILFAEFKQREFSPQMHEKFAIFSGQKIVWTGSCNFTGFGFTQSWDSITLLKNSHSLNQFITRFRFIKQHSRKASIKDLHQQKDYAKQSDKIDGTWNNELFLPKHESVIIKVKRAI